MPTKIVFDPNVSLSNLIYGQNYGVSTNHDPGVSYDGIYYGLGGADIIYDTDARGWIWAGLNDPSGVYFYGMGGEDVLVGFGGNDWLYGGAQDDILIANGGRDALYGEGGNDQLWGGDGADQLNGADGEDWVIGGGGGVAATRDVLWGGDHDSARDIMIGAVGSADQFVTSGNSVLNPASGGQTDIAWYFNLGEDTIQLRGAGAGSVYSDYSSPLHATYYGNYANTGLAGTLLHNDGLGFNPIIFLAGVSVTVDQLMGSNSIEYLMG